LLYGVLSCQCSAARAIIALLVSVFLPALSKARAVALKVRCQTQMRQVYIGMQAYAVDWNYYPSSYHKISSGDVNTFGGVFDYIGVKPRDFRKHSVQDMFWVCPSNPVAGNMGVTDVRDNLAWGYIDIGNYWTTHHFGFSESSFWSPMVPIDMVPGDHKKDPKPAQSMDSIVMIGELRSITMNRWRGGTGQMVFFHPQQTSHIVMMDGSFNDVTDNPTTEGWTFFK
jgi:hypothetical protein